MMSDSQVPLRWGIAGTGKISSDLCTAVKIKPEQHQVLGVAARSLEKAETFAKKFNIPQAYGSYEEMLTNPEIGIIYIGVINIGHYELCKSCLSSGKNVLCEKPLTMSPNQTEAIIALAKEKKVFLMEGFWTKFFPAYTWMLSEIKTGLIGEIKSAVIEFGENMESSERVNNPALGGGVILDIGCYPVLLACQLFGNQPNSITAVGTLNDAGVDVCESVHLQYNNNNVAVLVVNGQVKLRNAAVINGTKGQIEIPHFWHPDVLYINGKRKDFPLPQAPGEMNFDSSEGLIYEADHCRECIMKGLTESPVMTFRDSLAVSMIIDKIQKQLGVKHPSNILQL